MLPEFGDNADAEFELDLRGLETVDALHAVAHMIMKHSLDTRTVAIRLSHPPVPGLFSAIGKELKTQIAQGTVTRVTPVPVEKNGPGFLVRVAGQSRVKLQT